MAEIRITKNKIIAEDFEFGAGSVAQIRGGVPGTYTKFNSAVIPHTDGVTPLSDVVDGKAEQSSFDSHTGDTENPHSVTKAQVGLGNVDNTADLDKPISTDTQTALDDKADADDVLSMSASNPEYTPLYDYSPATKKYVQDTVTAIGAGDMAKSIYDTNDSGVVDNSEALGGFSSTRAMIDKGTITDADVVNETGLYTGTDVSNAPVSGYIILEHFEYGDASYQRCYAESNERWYLRKMAGSPTQIWQSWIQVAHEKNELIQLVKPGVTAWNALIGYVQNDTANVPGVAPVVCINVAGSTGNNPATDDGTYWVNFFNTHVVANSTTAFGIPLKVGTIVYDLDTRKSYTVTTLRSYDDTIADGSVLDIDAATVDGYGIDGLLNRGFKNQFINGGFNISQRGPQTNPGSRSSADQWLCRDAANIGGTTTHQNGIAIHGDSGRHYLSINHVGATSKSGYIIQRIEGLGLHGDLSLSFRQEETGTLTAMTCTVKRNYGTGGTPSSEDTYVNAVPLVQDGLYYSLSFTVPDMTGKSVGTDHNGYLEVWISYTWSSTDITMRFSDAQLEKGSVVTPFEQRPIGLELSLCQRYYEKLTEIYMLMPFGTTITSNSRGVTVPFKTVKRAIPTVTATVVYYSSSWVNQGEPSHTLVSTISSVRALMTGSESANAMAILAYTANAEL